MPKNKIKTHKGTAKRIKVTGGKKKKYIERRTTQDHFNAKESGNKTRAKRNDQQVDKTSRKHIKRLLPYS